MSIVIVFEEGMTVKGYLYIKVLRQHHMFHLVCEAGGQHQVVLQFLDNAVPLCRCLKKDLLGLTQFSPVLTLLFVVLPA